MTFHRKFINLALLLPTLWQIQLVLWEGKTLAVPCWRTLTNVLILDPICFS